MAANTATHQLSVVVPTVTGLLTDVESVAQVANTNRGELRADETEDLGELLASD